MSNYWKKKLDELNQANEKKTTKKSSSNYWQSKIDELEEEERKKNEDIAPVKTTTKEEKDDPGFFEKGHFSDGYQFGDLGKQTLDFLTGEGAYKDKGLAKTILGINDKDEPGFFDKGHFEDGYQFADLGKTAMDFITGEGVFKYKDEKDTKADLPSVRKWFGNSAMSGLASFNKGITSTADLILGTPLKAMGWENNPVSKMADYFSDGYDQFKNAANAEAEQLGGKGFKYGGDFIEGVVGAVPNAIMALMSAGTSLAGTGTAMTTEALTRQAAMQSGNLLTRAGLTTSAMLKNPQYWLSFAQTYGTDYEEAKDMGADDASAIVGATLSSLLNAGVEIGLDGMSGIQGLPENVAKGGKHAILEWVKSSLEEGSEEAVQGVINNAVAWALYDSDTKVLDGDQMLQEFAMGTAVGGVLGAGQIGVQKATNSIANAVEEQQSKKLTENEQKVVDKVFEDIVAEKEKDGEKLSDKEKSKIYDSVISDMEKGYINTDTIEEVLGGETYKSYKDTIDNEDALKSEFDTLNKMKQGEMTGEQIDRRAELKDILADLKKNSQRDTLKSQLGEEVFGLAQGSRLAESYNERARRGQNFEADISKYDEKQKAVIQKAIDSGILNNTNRTHEFVDFLAKMSADKGVLFDFLNNEKLKGTSFARDDAFVNGYYDKDSNTIGINIDSAKAVNSTVGHEITHVLEGTELYGELQNILFEYSKTKGEYESRREALAKLYAEEDIDSELAADLVGDYLFQDSEFINHLSVSNRNVFQKIYDEIKYLYKIATAGSKQARELEKVKRAFDKAYNESAKGAEGTKYSVSDNEGKALTKEQSEYFKDSKMRDDNGNLMVMYHGSQDAGFHTFDAKFSDDDTSFFFVDRNDVAATYSGTSETYAPRVFKNAEDANNFLKEMGFYGGKYGYEVVENDGKYTLLAGDEEIATSDNIADIYEEFCDYEGVGYGDANYKVYLNLKNPLVVDAQGGKWNDLRNWSKSAFVNAEDVAVKRVDGEFRLFDKTTNSEIENSTVAVNSYTESMDRNSLLHLMLDKANYALSINTEHLNTTRDVSKWAKAHGYDGVIFKNIHDNGGYSNGSEGASTVAIAFESNQIKSVANDKPTADKDIRYSLSENNEQTKVYGNYNIFGDDIRYKGNEVAVEETVEETVEEAETPTENIAPPIPETVAPKKRKPSRATLSRFTKKQTYSGGAKLQGAYNADGKQYLSDGIFVAEFNTVDEKIPHNKDYPIDKLKQILNNAVDGQSTEKYSIDLDKIIELNKANKGNRENKVIVGVGDALYDSKYIEAVMRAIPNPTFALSKFHGAKMLVAVGDNGTAVLMPLRAGENMNVAYEAQEIKAEVAPEGFAPTTEAEANAMSSEILDSLTDADAPPEVDAPYYGESDNATPSNPFAKRDYTKVGNPKTKSYISENPDALPFFKEAATAMLGDLQNSQKGEKWYNDRLYYESGGQEGIGGTRRETTADIADLLDGQYHYTYQQIENALNAIINNEPLNACAKRIEFALNDRLMNGYTDVYGNDIPANQDYINMLSRQQTGEVYQNNASSEVFTDADVPYTEEAPHMENPAPQPEAPIEEPIEAPTEEAEEVNTKEHIVRPDTQKGNLLSRAKESIRNAKKTLNDGVTLFGDKGWAIENLSIKTGNGDLQAKYDIMENRTVGMAQEYIKDNLVPIYEKIEKSGKLEDFEDYAYNLHNIDRMSLDTETAKARRAELKVTLDGYNEKQIESMASETITRNTPQDRIALIFAAREYVDLGGEKGLNKPVFGKDVTAEMSRKKVAEYEAANPEFKEFEQAVLEYNKAMRDKAVAEGLISQKTADLWAKMYPHYMPIRRVDRNGASVSVPLDTNKTGVNNPFKRATGGNKPFYPLFETMADNTEQIFRAINRNRFGIELMETLQAAKILDAEKAVDANTRQAINEGKLPAGTKVRAHDRENIGVIESFDSKTGKYSVYFKNNQGHHASVKLDANILSPIGLWNASVDGAEVDAHEVLESIDENDKAVLKEGKNGVSPSFTVFKNGKRVEFDITEEIYNALKPTNDFLAKTNKPINAMASGYKKLVTQYNPMFSFWRNPIKDTKDVLFNSQHAAKTYATAPETIKEFATKGKFYEEFRKMGGFSGSYYDTKTKTFTKKPSAVKKVVGFPLEAYENAGEKVEMFWRLSEYIASRKEGRSAEVSMLDAMRVTTNFAAGGDVTKFANRNGALFLNPSVQGAMQAVRNVREAYHKGAKGMAILAGKVLAVGLGGMLFNWLCWDDDEDYEELSDYAKQNYFMVAKTEDGKFIRIPKGRMEAVIQYGFEQMKNLVTGDDDVDWGTFSDLVLNNLAPNNPLENNLIAPIRQAINNKTWYKEDLVPTRLQDLPAAEQYDESTDVFSKWLGEKLGNVGIDISPYKINYVLDQYSGGIGDVVLPMLTPESEGEYNSYAEKAFVAPVKDELTVDPLMKNQSVSDFYTKVDELTKNANSAKATDKDILSHKYMNSINSELAELYAEKRAIQNSVLLSDSKKYEAVRRIQQQIVELTKTGLANYDNIRYDGGGEYAVIGDKYYQYYTPKNGESYWRKLDDEQTVKYKLTRDAGNAHYVTDGKVHYRLDEDGEWTKISDKQLERQNEVTKSLGITPDEYWSKTDISFMPLSNGEYEYGYDNPGKYAVSKAVGGYDAYRKYSTELYNIKADKDENGKSINGSRKDKVFDYINSLNIDYGAKLILWKSKYNADDSYNHEIVEYLNSRDDISYDDMKTILEELGFTVDSKGNITWD